MEILKIYIDKKHMEGVDDATKLFTVPVDFHHIATEDGGDNWIFIFEQETLANKALRKSSGKA